jgi:hypothetical protein
MWLSQFESIDAMSAHIAAQKPHQDAVPQPPAAVLRIAPIGYGEVGQIFAAGLAAQPMFGVTAHATLLQLPAARPDLRRPRCDFAGSEAAQQRAAAGRLPDARAVRHGRRRAAEIREVAHAVEDAGMQPLMAAATAQRHDWPADQVDAATLASDEQDWRRVADAIRAAAPRC